MKQSYFDETIFTSGESLFKYPEINAYNDADEYLLKRQNIPVGSPDEITSTGVNLNPRHPSLGIDIYSINNNNISNGKNVPFNQILIYDGETTTPIVIGEHVSGQIYTVGQLTSLESAIMLKFYAVNNPNVYITKHLYAYVEPYFQDARGWFRETSIGITQNNKKELILNNEILNIPPLNFSSDPINYD